MLDKLELYKIVASFRFFKNMSSSNLGMVGLKKRGKEGKNVNLILDSCLYLLARPEGMRKSHQICKLCLTRNRIMLDYNKGFPNISWEEEARCGFLLLLFLLFGKYTFQLLEANSGLPRE